MSVWGLVKRREPASESELLLAHIQILLQAQNRTSVTKLASVIDQVRSDSLDIDFPNHGFTTSGLVAIRNCARRVATSDPIGHKFSSLRRHPSLVRSSTWDTRSVLLD